MSCWETLWKYCSLGKCHCTTNLKDTIFHDLFICKSLQGHGKYTHFIWKKKSDLKIDASYFSLLTKILKLGGGEWFLLWINVPLESNELSSQHLQIGSKLSQFFAAALTRELSIFMSSRGGNSTLARCISKQFWDHFVSVKASGEFWRVLFYQ